MGGAAAVTPLSRAWAIARLVHPFPVSIVVLTSAALVLVAHGGYPGGSFLLRAVAAVLFCQASVGALNDYVDKDIDRIFQRDKPIACGQATERSALVLTVSAALVSALFALTFGWPSMIVLLLATSGGWAYDLWLSRGPFSVAGYLAGFMGLLTWIWLINSRLNLSFLLVYAAGAPIIAAAHLANAAPDLETDREMGVRNLAVVLGERRLVPTIFTLYALSALAGTALVVAAHSVSAATVLIASLVVAGVAAIVARNTTERPARLLLFKLFAPAAGLLGVGCLMALRQIS